MPTAPNTTLVNHLGQLRRLCEFFDRYADGTPVSRSKVREHMGISERNLDRLLSTARQGGLPVVTTGRKKLYKHTGKRVTFQDIVTRLATPPETLAATLAEKP